ncbi:MULTISPECIES: hypothetical protein [Burkholderiaceae]|uniref:hypothetical protein n=1 Tax=Burkholderiaceae TaxID=119060 RepID=UPI0016214ECA|nr:MULTISPECIES: hypothetical protein [Burkholderiaceae]MBB2981619.1 hypothetical protein [Paraburkholderia tropica]
MDVAWFLNRRLDFIRQLYARSSEPFVDRRTKIENEEDPWIPPYSEDGDPPFELEWQEASDSINVLGHTCLCLLASSLQAYLQTRVILHCEKLTDEERKRVFRKGWIRGYNTIFTEAFGIPLENGPVSLDALEDIVLTRNSIQHEVELTSMRPRHADRKPGATRSVFLDAREVELLDGMDPGASSWLAPPTVHVDQKALETSIDTVQRFVAWLDAAIEEKLYGLR